MVSLRKKKETEKKTEREKVEERREEVLARGKKFKYPLQFAKHRLVGVTIAIAVVAVGVMVAIGWGMLFRAQNTGDVIYRITRVLPVAVAEVDGEKVRYSDYLMIYRSSIEAVEQQSGQLMTAKQQADESIDGVEAVKKEYRRAALTEAEELAYARKIARENGIEVTSEEIAEAFEKHRTVGGSERSEESFLKVIKDNFGLTKREYERVLEMALVKEKVQMMIDKKANSVAGEVEKMLKENGGDFAKVREALGAKVVYEETGGLVDNKNIDGGRADVAAKLAPGEVSGRFVSSNGDGYYFVKLIAKNETQVNYASIKVEFAEFEERFQKVELEGGVREYIEL